MSKEHILVLEDEPHVLELIKQHLTKDGYRVSCAMRGRDCLDAVTLQQPNMVLLDLMLPDMDGFEVLRRIRADEHARNTPVIILSAMGDEPKIVEGLELGADDYVVKPFSKDLLSARIKSVFRRQQIAPSIPQDDINLGELLIRPSARAVFVDNSEVQLTTFEFGLLHLLVRKPGTVFTRSQIIRAVHAGEHEVTSRSVDVQVVGLRKKLGSAGKLIETIRGVGYRFNQGAFDNSEARPQIPTLSSGPVA